MSKEILHRAKRTDTGEWVEGYYVKLKLTGTAYILPGDAEVEPCKKGILQFVCYQVDPETVCRYTGMDDVKKRKIFEGDIVNCKEKRGAAFWHCRVVWNDVWARFDVIAMDCSFPMCLDECDGEISINGSDYEVIGNIYDNQELLRGA